MTKEQAIQEFKELTEKLINIIDQLGQQPKPEFSPHYDITNFKYDVLARVHRQDSVQPTDRAGCARFVPEPDDKLDAAWFIVAMHLIQRIANPHLSKDGIKEILNGIRMLFDLHIEKFGVKY